VTNTNPEAASLQAEIAELRREVSRLSEVRDRLHRAAHSSDSAIPTTDNIYVFDDEDVEARAFDDFYRAYDEVHAKTRKFLLG